MLSPESLARLSVLERLLIWVLVAIVVGIVGYAVFYTPVRADLRAATNELEGARAKLNSARQELGRKQELADQLTRDEQAVAAEIAATPGADGPVEDPIFTLPELARLSGLQVERWQPLALERVGAWGMRKPVRVHARGTWPSFADFLRRAGDLRETMAVDELSLRPAAGGEAGVLEISFRASVVWVRPDLALHAGQDPDASARL